MTRTLMPPQRTNQGLERVCDVAARCWNLPRYRINGRTRPREDLGADSLDILDLLTELEQAFSIPLPDDAAKQMDRLDDLLVFLAPNR